MEHWCATAKDAIRQKMPLTLEDARRIIRDFVTYYNDRRLHCALGYVPPLAALEGYAESIFVEAGAASMRHPKLARLRGPQPPSGRTCLDRIHSTGLCSPRLPGG